MIRRVLVVGSFAALLAAVGCRSPRTDNTMELLNAEKRALEDRIYEWEYEYEILEDELEDTKEENERLRDRLRDDDSRDSAIPRRILPDRNRDEDGPPDFRPPDIDLGEPTGGTQTSTSHDSGSPDSELEEIATPQPDSLHSKSHPNSKSKLTGDRPLTAALQDAAEQAAPTRIADADDQITSIAIVPLLSTGADFDEKPGDDGLNVVLQPRNVANHFVPRAGKISLALLDPAIEGPQAVVGRWNFGPSEIRRSLKTRGDQLGIHLKVAWPAEPPKNNRLRLYVRYETQDGRKLQSQREVFVRLAGERTAWTPRQRSAPASQRSVPTNQRSTPADSGTREEAAASLATRPDNATAPEPKPEPQQPPTRPKWTPYR